MSKTKEEIPATDKDAEIERLREVGKKLLSRAVKAEEENNQLRMDNMTHEYNQAEAEKFAPEFERQIREDEREKCTVHSVANFNNMVERCNNYASEVSALQSQLSHYKTLIDAADWILTCLPDGEPFNNHYTGDLDEAIKSYQSLKQKQP